MAKGGPSGMLIGQTGGQTRGSRRSRLGAGWSSGRGLAGGRAGNGRLPGGQTPSTFGEWRNSIRRGPAGTGRQRGATGANGGYRWRWRYCRRCGWVPEGFPQPVPQESAGADRYRWRGRRRRCRWRGR
ncbi:PE-PGRS family protein [Mycobacterium tuberculosis EAS054]|nr:PE-PGRS family protein [Mycobacterium tuberculosis EAS054]